jgi:hypothetical protein
VISTEADYERTAEEVRQVRLPRLAEVATIERGTGGL